MFIPLIIIVIYFNEQVKLSVFITYARAIGTPYFVLYMVLYVLFTAASVFSNTWISYWTEDDTLNNITVFGNSSLRREKNDFYFGIYGGLGGIQGNYIYGQNNTYLAKTKIS